MLVNRFAWLWVVLFVLRELLGIEPAQAHPGWGVVIDSKGQVYFGDVNRNVVWKIDASGTVTRFVSGVHSHDLRIDKDDNIYGEHTRYDAASSRFETSYWKASPEGKVWDITDSAAYSIFRPHDFDGNEYEAEGNVQTKQSRIVKKTPDGTSTIFVGGTWGYADGKGVKARIQALGTFRLGPDSALYLTEGGRVRRITFDGTVTTLAGPAEGYGDPADKIQSSSFLGLTFDDRRNVYAANWQKRKVIRMSPDGGINTVLESGFGWEPSGVAWWRGEVFVLEHRSGVTILLEKAGLGGPRVRKISADGTVTTVGTAP